MIAMVRITISRTRRNPRKGARSADVDARWTDADALCRWRARRPSDIRVLLLGCFRHACGRRWQQRRSPVKATCRRTISRSSAQQATRGISPPRWRCPSSLSTASGWRMPAMRGPTSWPAIPGIVCGRLSSTARLFIPQPPGRGRGRQADADQRRPANPDDVTPWLSAAVKIEMAARSTGRLRTRLPDLLGAVTPFLAVVAVLGVSASGPLMAATAAPAFAIAFWRNAAATVVDRAGRPGPVTHASSAALGRTALAGHGLGRCRSGRPLRHLGVLAQADVGGRRDRARVHGGGVGRAVRPCCAATGSRARSWRESRLRWPACWW